MNIRLLFTISNNIPTIRHMNRKRVLTLSNSFTDYKYQWLDEEFSPGNFKSMSVKGKTTKPIVKPTASATLHEPGKTKSDGSGLFVCPQDGCIRVFKRFVTLNYIYGLGV